MRYLITVAMLLLVAGCTNESDARRTLNEAGYTSVHITGWSPMTCSEQDFSSTGFRAKGPTGVQTSGVVCCGLFFKNCTIRH